MKIGYIWLLMAALTFGLTGCGDETNTSITNVTQGDNGVYIHNADGTVTYVADAFNEGDASDGTTGEYDASDDEEECRSKNFFWCPITKTCNNTAASGGSCTGR